MEDLPPLSGRSSYDVSSRPRPLNFSRPRPLSNLQPKVQHRSDAKPVLHEIHAFHESTADPGPPDEPRFSIDSQRTETTSPRHSVAAELAWDGQLGELRSLRRPEEYDRNQRYFKSPSHSRSATSTSQASANTPVASDEPLLDVPDMLDSCAPPHIPPKDREIVKRIDVDEQSERTSLTSSQGGWEDTASHHTVSVADELVGGYPPERAWSSSDYDTSGLSAVEICKLRKKGINPALFAEMKAARKGRGKWVGPLVGNTYIG